MIIVKLIGGLGNQMFQYAAAYSLARKLKQPLLIDNLYYRDTSKRRHRFTYRPYGLSLFNISAEIATPKQITKFTLPRIFNKYIYNVLRRIFPEHNMWNENLLRSYLYDTQTIAGKNGGGYLEGFFQDYSFFESYLDDLKGEFVFKEPISKQSIPVLEDIERSKSICIVFRRGDYVGHPVLDIIGLDYYYQALSYFTKDHKIFVFSDDIPWCIDNFKPEGFKVHFVDQMHTGDLGGNYLQIMMKCNNFIIPNSTYPYWAALLSPSKNKKVIAPKVWFKGQDSSERNSILPPEWIAI